MGDCQKKPRKKTKTN